MKKLFTLSILMIVTGLVLTQKEKVIDIWNKIYSLSNKEVTLDEKNEYYRDYDFDFVQNTENFSPYCKQDIYNIYYTIINSGKENFTFYCPSDYSNCIDDINDLANDQTKLSDINNFVHPYNGFQHIETEYDNLGKVTVYIEKSYSNSEIKKIDEKIDYIEKNVLNSNYSSLENIKLAHNYIINNSIYDTNRSDQNVIYYKSDLAYGPLIEGYGICGGYTDAMELILERLGIKSYKISSDNHVWNAVNLDNNWYHLDLTWDDPVVSDGSQILDHSFFLIETDKLLEIEKTQHRFDQDIYYELKQNKKAS